MKSIFSLIAVAILLFACSNKTTYKIEGTLPNNSLDGEVLYMYISSNSKQLAERMIIDSTAIIGNKYSFMGNIDVPNTVRYIDLKKNNGTYSLFTVYPEQGVTLTVEHADIKNLWNFATSGSELNKAINQVKREKDNNKAIEMMHDFAEKHIETEAGTEVYITTGMFLATYFDKDLELINKYLSRINDKYKEDSRISITQKILPGLLRTKAGNDFFDIAGKNLKGDSITLSDYVGKKKYTLCYFSGSWCMACMMGMPDLMKFYNKHKDNELEIFIVALDKIENWKDAAERHNIECPNIVVSDGGLFGKTAIEYGVSAAPYSFLIDDKGKIIAKNLSLEDLDKELKISR